MAMLRVFECDICGFKQAEKTFGAGVNGWGQLSGICLDGVDNPLLCPDHLAMVANYTDKLKRGEANGME